MGHTAPPADKLALYGNPCGGGSARAVVARTGKETEFGNVSERLKLRPPETEFEHGVRRFGYLLMEITLVLVIAIFAINVFLSRLVLDSFLFALALAVGLTPQLLTATLLIVAVTIILPIAPLAELLGFRPLPISILLAIGIIVVLNIIAAEVTKRVFYKRVTF